MNRALSWVPSHHMTTVTGRVNNVKEQKYGFISCQGQNIFFHFSEVDPKDKDAIYKGCEVQFVLADSHEAGKKKACQVKVIGSVERLNGTNLTDQAAQSMRCVCFLEGVVDSIG